MKEDVLQIGKWLEFRAGTCFGSSKNHFGILVGLDYEKNIAVVAVNATSQIENLIYFADLHNIPVEDAMVDVTDDLHFSKPTGIDCHRPKEIPLERIRSWMHNDMVRLSPYNAEVPQEKIVQIVGVIDRSPLVEDRIKEIVKSSTRKYFL